MAKLTNFKLIKAITRGDDNIQALDQNDPAVLMALDMAENMVSESIYGKDAQIAQTYFAAHVLSMAAENSGGRGPLSSETVGDVSVSYTLPYLNQTSVLGSTQYGLMYIQYRRQHVVPVLVGFPG